MHRNRSEWIEAVIAYRRALEWLPWREDLHIQIGNCFKEYGDYPAAMAAYQAVTAGMHRAEAQKQMEDASHRAGGGILPYATAERADRAPRAGRGAEPPVMAGGAGFPNRIQIEQEEPRRWLGSLGQDGHRARAARTNNYPSILFDQVGALSIVREGAMEPLLVGIVAVRVRVTSHVPLTDVELWLGEDADAVLVRVEPVSTLR